MILYIIDLAIVVGFLIFSFCLNTFSGLLQAFLLHIDMVNGLFLGAVSGYLAYSNNRHFHSFYEKDIHPAICLVIGIVIFFSVIAIQHTKIGFWLFAIIMSILWALIISGITYFITHDKTWFWVVQVLATIVNINSHLTSRRLNQLQANQ